MMAAVATGNETATVRCGSSKGPVVMKFYRSWSPHGYDRVTELFAKGFFDYSHIFRCIPHFVCQFGLTYSEDPDLRRFMEWEAVIPDDPLPEHVQFEKGTIAFAGGGKNSRTCEIFISLRQNDDLGDEPFETPIGEVAEGMENVLQWYSYGEDEPDQDRIEEEGISYVQENYPLLDMLETCTIQRFQPNARLVAKTGGTDASAPLLPKNAVAMGAVCFVGLAAYALLRRRGKGPAKTQ